MNEYILYIDDEKDLLDLAISFFEDEQLELDTCNCFNDALALIRNNKYSLIICDVQMPSGSGHELLKIVRQEKVFTGKIILVTGNLNEHKLPQSREYDLILYKPIDFQELIEKVKGLLLINF